MSNKMLYISVTYNNNTLRWTTENFDDNEAETLKRFLEELNICANHRDDPLIAMLEDE